MFRVKIGDKRHMGSQESECGYHAVQSKCLGPWVLIDFDYVLIEMLFQAEYIFVHHSSSKSEACSAMTECIATVKRIQTDHITSNKWRDIGYSFLIGEDGNVYEGRGYRKSGSHTYGFNDNAYGIAFLGNFNDRNPNDMAIKAFHDLVDVGTSLTFHYMNHILKDDF